MKASERNRADSSVLTILMRVLWTALAFAGYACCYSPCLHSFGPCPPFCEKLGSIIAISIQPPTEGGSSLYKLSTNTAHTQDFDHIQRMDQGVVMAVF